MRVQIRPAIYNFKVRYEVWKVITEASFWSGSKLSYEQCYFIQDDLGWVAIDYNGWWYANNDTTTSGDKVRRSFKTLKLAKEVLDQSFGNSYEVAVWRPQT